MALVNLEVLLFHFYKFQMTTNFPFIRLLLIDPNKSQWKVLMGGLHMASGVQLHTDGFTVILGEAGLSRLWRVALDGSGAAHFGPPLPGSPGNVRKSSRGGYWIPMFVPRHAKAFHPMEWFARWPILRSNIFKVRRLLKLTNQSSALLV